MPGAAGLTGGVSSVNKFGIVLLCLSVAVGVDSFAKMGVTAMAVGGAFGIAAKGTVNRLMKVSIRRGENSESNTSSNSSSSISSRSSSRSTSADEVSGCTGAKYTV